MKRINKLFAGVLAVVMLFSGLYISPAVVSAAETVNASTWKNTAITSPAQGKLIGAGYIDVKWNNNLENVSKYSVYVDRKLQKTLVATSEETMSCEFYTTQVSAHTAYIIAELKSGAKVTTNTVTFYVTKKGLCVNDRDMGTAVDPAALNVGWYYNWGYKSFEETRFKNTKFYDLDYAPMIYGEPKEEYSKIFDRVKSNGYKYLLGYNEPDLAIESNISSSIAASRFRYYFMPNKGNLRIASPAISTASAVFESKWWSPYWNALNANEKANTSVIAVHKYYEYYNADTAYEFLELIDKTYETYKKPIWVTEFALWRWKLTDKDAAKTNEFLRIVCKGLNERSYVERYSWFSTNVDNASASSSALFNYATGELTNLGKVYAQIGNPAGYPSKTYGVASGTSANTSAVSCATQTSSKIYSVTGKKKSFKIYSSKIKRAAGYQVEYSVKKNLKGSKKKTLKAETGTVKIKFTKAQKKKIKKKKLKKIKYYVRVRAYKKVFGTTAYCKWSPKKSVKVKTK